MPLQVVNVDVAASIDIALQDEDLAVRPSLVLVEKRAFRLEQRRLVVLVFLALDGVGGADELLEPQALEVLGEEPREV